MAAHYLPGNGSARRGLTTNTWQEPAEGGDGEEESAQLSEADLEGVGVSALQSAEEDHAGHGHTECIAKLLHCRERSGRGAGALWLDVRKHG